MTRLLALGLMVVLASSQAFANGTAQAVRVMEAVEVLVETGNGAKFVEVFGTVWGADVARRELRNYNKSDAARRGVMNRINKALAENASLRQQFQAAYGQGEIDFAAAVSTSEQLQNASVNTSARPDASGVVLSDAASRQTLLNELSTEAKVVEVLTKNFQEDGLDSLMVNDVAGAIKEGVVVGPQWVECVAKWQGGAEGPRARVAQVYAEVEKARLARNANDAEAEFNDIMSSIATHVEVDAQEAGRRAVILSGDTQEATALGQQALEPNLDCTVFNPQRYWNTAAAQNMRAQWLQRAAN